MTHILFPNHHPIDQQYLPQTPREPSRAIWPETDIERGEFGRNNKASKVE